MQRNEFLEIQEEIQSALGEQSQGSGGGGRQRPNPPRQQASGAEDEPPKKVTFTPEQQGRIDEIVRESMGRAGRDARNEAAQLRQELETLKALNPSAQAADPGAQLLATQLAEIKSERDALLQERQNATVTDALRKAAIAANFVDIDLGVEVLRRNVRFENGKLIVVDDTGAERRNEMLEPASVEELARSVAAAKPFLIRGSVAAGTGSSEARVYESQSAIPLESVFGPKSNAGLANKLALSRPKEYARMKAAAKAKGLVG